jgi:predicted ATPase with chaperone activity
MGKSRLARRLTTILPAMSLAEVLETMRIPRVAGLTDARMAVITMRPCCALTTPPRMWDGSVGVCADAR